MATKHTGFEKLAEESQLLPQEKLAAVSRRKKSLFIGIPKEISLNENRVPLTPEAVALVVQNGHRIMLEAGAGDKAQYTDQEYSEAGADIVYDTQKVYQAEIILKIEPPTDEEIEYLKPGQVLISALNLVHKGKEFFVKLMKKRVIALAYEYIEDKVGGQPITRAMSEIAGTTAIQVASELLSTTAGGQGVILGGITGVPPTKLVILGAGTVAEYAARAAWGMGADINILDNHIYKLNRLKHALGFPVFTSTIDSALLTRVLRDADILIGALRPEKGRNRMVVTEEMVMNMKKGAVIIDLSIDQGGCVETSEMTTLDNPVYVQHDVIHCCIPNITSKVARTASQALSNIFTPTIIRAGEEGSVEDMIFSHKWFMNGVYVYKDGLANFDLANRFKLPYKDISLFRAARL
ncbi:MAG TPA: alanine dehydrogenase [Flammeovirgaceae bacterium]|nr:alanine dehydrogenase [Flammeovirgaceae bacterium]